MELFVVLQAVTSTLLHMSVYQHRLRLLALDLFALSLKVVKERCHGNLISTLFSVRIAHTLMELNEWL